MAWTNKTPAKNGFYWVREPGEEARVMEWDNGAWLVGGWDVSVEHAELLRNGAKWWDEALTPPDADALPTDEDLPGDDN